MAETGGGGGGILCGTDFYALPGECIPTILSLTSARDACRVAAVSKLFWSAADSDWLWLQFLPPDYQAILERSEEGAALLDSLSKKRLYHRLIHRPILVGEGTKSFWLDRKTGKKCYLIAARNLDIVWSGTPRYWRWSPLPESRFSEVAELITVCWLEIRGKIKTSLLSGDMEYAAYLVFKVTEAAYGLDEAEASVGTPGGKTTTRVVQLVPDDNPHSTVRFAARYTGIFGRARPPPTGRQAGRGSGERDDKWPKRRPDGWLELKLGQFVADDDDDYGEVEISLLEIKAGNWKRGLIVEGIELRPVVAS